MEKQPDSQKFDYHMSSVHPDQHYLSSAELLYLAQNLTVFYHFDNYELLTHISTVPHCKSEVYSSDFLETTTCWRNCQVYKFNYDL